MLEFEFSAMPPVPPLAQAMVFSGLLFSEVVSYCLTRMRLWMGSIYLSLDLEATLVCDKLPDCLLRPFLRKSAYVMTADSGSLTFLFLLTVHLFFCWSF